MKKAVLLKLFLLVFSATLGLTSAWAVQPQINYQGLLNDSTGAPVNDPNVTMIFRLWNDATSILTSNLLWEETQTVDVANGVYNVLLGSVTPLPDGVTIGAENLWLEVTVSRHGTHPSRCGS